MKDLTRTNEDLNGESSEKKTKNEEGLSGKCLWRSVKRKKKFWTFTLTREWNFVRHEHKVV